MNKINIPKGKKLVSVNLDTGVYILKDIELNIREKINTLDDIFKLNGTTQKEFDKNYGGLPKHTQGYILECMIANAYNEGRKTVFNEKDYHYIAWWNIIKNEITLDDCYYYGSYSTCSAFLFFNGDEAKLNCQDAAEKFIDIYKMSRV